MSPSKHVRGGVSSLGRSHVYQPKPCTVGNLKPPLDCIKAQWGPPMNGPYQQTRWAIPPTNSPA